MDQHLISDAICKEESLAPRIEDWTVWREDDNSARFVVRAGLTCAAAKALAEELQLRGHKQFYWSEPTARR
jgi:8-oxo-dGTP diphosphatase